MLYFISLSFSYSRRYISSKNHALKGNNVMSHIIKLPFYTVFMCIFTVIWSHERKVTARCFLQCVFICKPDVKLILDVTCKKLNVLKCKICLWILCLSKKLNPVTKNKSCYIQHVHNLYTIIMPLQYAKMRKVQFLLE